MVIIDKERYEFFIGILKTIEQGEIIGKLAMTACPIYECLKSRKKNIKVPLVYFALYNAYKELKIPIVPEILLENVQLCLIGSIVPGQTTRNTHKLYSIKNKDFDSPVTDFNHVDIMRSYLRLSVVSLGPDCPLSRIRISKVRKTWKKIINSNLSQWRKLDKQFKIRVTAYYMLRYYCIVFMEFDLPLKQWISLTRIQDNKINLPPLLLKF